MSIPAGLVLLGLLPASQVDRSEKLNSIGPVTTGTVASFQFSPNHRWIVYELDGELHALTRNGTQRQLSSPGQILDAYRITSDSARVIYMARSAPGAPSELWSTKGSLPPVRLSGPLVSGGSVRTFALGPDGLRAYYTADQDVDETFQVHGVPSDGSAPPQALTPGHQVLYSFQLSPDGTQLVFHCQVSGRNELFVVPSDGSGSPARLNPQGRTAYSPYVFSPDGGRLAFRAGFNGRTELYTVPLDLSSSAVVLNGPMAFGGEVIDFDFAPDGQSIAFEADLDGDTRDELYLGPADGSATAARLDGGVGSVIRPLFSPDGARIVFMAAASPSGLFSVALAGGPPVRINGAQGFVGQIDYVITPDSRWVVYLDRNVGNRRELYSTPIDGSGPPVRLSDPLVSTGNIANFQLGPNGRQVVYIGDPNVKGQFELFVRLVDGSQPARLLNPPLESGGSVGFDFALVDPGAVFFRADARLRLQSELYWTPLVGGTATVVEGLLPRVAPQVSGFRLSPDEQRIVYVEAADLAPDERVGLRSVELASPGSTVRLSASIGAPFEPTFGPDPERVYFTGVVVGAGLFSVPLDASEPPSLLTPTQDVSLASLRFSSTGRHVLTGSNADFNYLVALDASQAVRGLGYAGDFTGDGGQVVYFNGDYNPFTGSFENFLYTQPSDLSSPAVELTPPNVLREFQIAGNDSSSFFAVYRSTSNRLFRVHAPDAAFQDQLSPTGHNVAAFQNAPDGSRVVYVALGLGLFRVDVFTLSSPVQLAGPVLVDGDTFLPLGSGPRITFTPDGSRALYLASGQASGRIELFSVPLDASSPPARLSGPFVAGGNVRGDPGSFVISPNGARVVYLADQEVDERFELFSVPVDGSVAAAKLSGALASDRDVELPVSVLAHSIGVVFRSDLDLDERLDLWFAALDGRGAPRRINGALLPESDVQADFVIDGENETVFYRADQDVDGRVELYRHPLSPRPRGQRR